MEKASRGSSLGKVPWREVPWMVPCFFCFAFLSLVDQLADRLAKYGATLERNAFRYYFLLLFTALEVAVAQTVWE